MKRSVVKSSQTQVPVPLGDRSYNIIIQEELLREAGTCLQEAGLSGRVGVVTNPIIGKLYGKQLTQSLKKAGFPSTVMVIPEGEQAKSLKWTSKILDELVTGRFERRDILLALGGGVIGDITGFVKRLFL